MLDVFVLLLSILFINSPLFERHGFNYHFNFETTLVLFILLIPSYLFLYRMFKLYTPQRTNKSIFSESSKISQVNFIEYLFLSVMCTLDILMVPVNFLILFLVVNIIFAIVERAILRGILRVLRARGFNIKYILIVGAGEVGRKLVDTIHVNTYLGYKVVGFLDDNVIGTVNNIKVMGTVDDIETILNDVMIDRVIVSISPRHYKRLEYIMESCEKMGVRADIVPDYYRYITSNPSIELIDNIPLISVRYLPLDISYNKVIKRIFDIIFVSIVSIIISPLLLVTAILIKLTSAGPVIYKQERVGENGKIFLMYKFRSMYSENEYIDDENWTQKNDPRITRVGKIIRKTSIDELPQFYNILKGEMSLIGPRPERPFFVNKFRETVPKYMIKHHVQPGMTGWAQINGYRGNTSIVKRIEHDIYYVENWSISLDIKIFFKTLSTLLTDPNAY
ncbi:undecaprenyl-phosphate glucose phosphotransferase [Methanosphaera sp.]